MTYVPYVAIVLAFLQIHVPRQVAGGEMKKLAGGYDNSDPRGQQRKNSGKKSNNKWFFHAFPTAKRTRAQYRPR